MAQSEFWVGRSSLEGKYKTAVHKYVRRLNGFLGLSLNDGTILFLVILFDKKVSVG